MAELFHDYNGDKLVDVNCGRMIPVGNLDTAQSGSYASMRKALDRAYAGNTNFKACTPYGFQPGYTMKGLEGSWGIVATSK